MTPLIYPFETTECELCGTTVAHSDLTEHMVADVRFLRIIQSNRPEWGHQECEAYLRSLFAPRFARHDN